jgi:hypothetical protein
MMETKLRVGDLVTCTLQINDIEHEHTALLLRQYSWPAGWIALIDGQEWKIPEKMITGKAEHEGC